jgi:hypothetical protein
MPLPREMILQTAKTPEQEEFDAKQHELELDVIYRAQRLLSFKKPGWFGMRGPSKTGVAEYIVNGQEQHNRMNTWLVRPAGQAPELFTQEIEDVGGLWRPSSPAQLRVTATQGGLTWGRDLYPLIYEGSPEQRLEIVQSVRDNVALIELVQGAKAQDPAFGRPAEA